MSTSKFVVPTWISKEPAGIQLEGQLSLLLLPLSDASRFLFQQASKNGEVVDMHDLSEKNYYVIGRNKDLSNLTLEHPSISKSHAVILNGTPHGQPGCSIIDLGSSNGTFLGNSTAKMEPIQAHRSVCLISLAFLTTQYCTGQCFCPTAATSGLASPVAFTM
jgi:hypothetical protein